jgi:hypothetical protein
MLFFYSLKSGNILSFRVLNHDDTATQLSKHYSLATASKAKLSEYRRITFSPLPTQKVMFIVALLHLIMFRLLTSRVCYQLYSYTSLPW